MSQYVVHLVHTADQCPTSNAKIRERVARGLTELPQFAEKLGVRILAGPLALAVEHESFALIEAPTPEAAQTLMMHSGLMQWNTVRVSLATPLADVMRDLANMPPPLS